MGQAKQRRDAKGTTDERTSTEIEAARMHEIRRIAWHASGQALVQRRQCIGIETSREELCGRGEVGDG